LGESTKRQRLFTIIKILVGFTLLFLSIRGVEWGQFSVSLKSVNPVWLLGLFVSMVLGLLLKVIRWVILMRKYGLSVSFRRVAEAFFMG
jgi:uncharacterized membrane protein YbhN (UPF0104 family)